MSATWFKYENVVLERFLSSFFVQYANLVHHTPIQESALSVARFSGISKHFRSSQLFETLHSAQGGITHVYAQHQIE